MRESHEDTLRYCSLCGDELFFVESGQTEQGTVAMYVCRSAVHYSEHTVFEFVQQRDNVRAICIKNAADGYIISDRQKRCFLCGADLDYTFTYTLVTHDEREFRFYICRTSDHYWEEQVDLHTVRYTQYFLFEYILIQQQFGVRKECAMLHSFPRKRRPLVIEVEEE